MKRLFVPLLLIAVASALSLRSAAQEATKPFVPVTELATVAEKVWPTV